MSKHFESIDFRKKYHDQQSDKLEWTFSRRLSDSNYNDMIEDDELGTEDYEDGMKDIYQDDRFLEKISRK